MLPGTSELLPCRGCYWSNRGGPEIPPPFSGGVPEPWRWRLRLCEPVERRRLRQLLHGRGAGGARARGLPGLGLAGHPLQPGRGPRPGGGGRAARARGGAAGPAGRLCLHDARREFFQLGLTSGHNPYLKAARRDGSSREGLVDPNYRAPAEDDPRWSFVVGRGGRNIETNDEQKKLQVQKKKKKKEEKLKKKKWHRKQS